MLKAVIFDMDGVLLDTERTIIDCWKIIAKKYNLKDIETVALKCIGTNAETTKNIVLSHYGMGFDYGKAVREVSEMLYKKYPDAPPKKPGAAKCLSFLRDLRVKTALATSTNQEIAARQLKAAGLYDFFDTTVFGDDVKESKPQPDIFIHAIKKLAVSPDESIIVEDSLNGMLAAHLSGAHPVMIPDLIPPTPEIKEIAYRIFDSLDDFISYLKTELS